MPESMVATAGVQEPNVKEDPTPQTTPATAPVPEADVDKMDLKQLEAFVATGKPAEGSPEQGKPAETTDWIEVTVDDKTKLRFRNQDEVNKSLVNSQQLIRRQKEAIDKYNAERGTYATAQQQIQALNAQIQTLQAGAQQMQAGRQPNQYTANALSALQQQPGQDPISLLYGEITALKNDLATQTGQFQEVYGSLKAKEAEALIDSGVQGLYREVDGFLQKHPEYKPAEDFARLDDIASQYGDEVAQTMVSPDDWAKYQAVMGIVGLYKNDPATGQFSLERKNQQDLEEAFLIQQHRTGALGNAIAQAHKSGIQSYDRVLQRQAQSATTLPNTLSSGDKPQMGAAEVESIMAMDPAQIKGNPELTQRFNEACRALGINPTL